MLNGDEIVGCFALITNDFINRLYLLPWFACLYVEPKHRGKKLSSLILDHARKEAETAGYHEIFLTTDHDDFYEKFGWTRIDDGYDLSGEISKIYRISV